MNRRTLLLCGLLLSCLLTRAQDPHFSQFFASPLTLNPAYTGKIDGTFRFAANYRNQWPTINNAFTTFTASLDAPILTKRLPYNDTWGVGLMALNDQSGNQILQNTFISFSTAYHKGLDENGFHQLAVGFQGTLARKRLDITKADFEDELTPLGFTGVTQEVFSNDNININYFDFNTGLLYTGTTNGYNSFYLGASLYHVNRPRESFIGGNFLLGSRVTIHGGGYVPVDDRKTFHTSFIHQRQSGATETVLGGAMAFNFNDNIDNPTSLYTGVWYRFGDAVYPYVGIEVAGLRLGFTYDITLSSLNTASNSRGGAEFSLIYIKKPVDQDLRRLNCPKF